VIVGSFHLPPPAAPLPCELYLWPDGRSYTGQPVAEIHTLGSPPLLEAALRTLCAAGARPAEAGEFTLRAFLAGRLELTQAEAVLGVVDAAGPEELHVALGQLAGGLARPLYRLREMLVDLLAHLEAGLDFAEEDLPLVTPQQLRARLSETAATVAGLVRQIASRSQSAGAARVVLVGRPNTGKSSLFNVLSGGALALVSHQPGTTRDYLTAQLDLDGVPCQLLDTAGLGAETADVPVTAAESPSVQQAAEGVSREQGRRAQVRILCLDSTRPPDDWEQYQLAQPPAIPQILVLTKADIGPRTEKGVGCLLPQTPATNLRLVPGCAEKTPDPLSLAIATSSVSGEGIDALRSAIRAAVLSTTAAGTEVVAATAVRCRHSLRMAAGCLERARRLAATGQGEELVAAEIRVALGELGKVAGTVYTEDLLEKIFSRFCIGK
jgi:tRNA modification GTPase